jgi:hypothetical protein
MCPPSKVMMVVKSLEVASLYRQNSPPMCGEDTTVALEALHTLLSDWQSPSRAEC